MTKKYFLLVIFVCVYAVAIGLTAKSYIRSSGLRETVESNKNLALLLKKGILFNAKEYPNFLRGVYGMSHPEAWGAWSDSTYLPEVRIEFRYPLPAEFTVEIEAFAFGPNVNLPTQIIIGDQVKSVTFDNNIKSYRIPFEMNGINEFYTIMIKPPMPTSPKEMDPKNSDSRMLGLGLISLKITD